MDLKMLVLGVLGCFSVWHVFNLTRDVQKHSEQMEGTNTVQGAVVGLVVNFFDALGIGSFAPSAAIFKGTGMVKDRAIPGTLNVANTVSALAQAFIYTTMIAVEPWTLVLMILSAVLGAWLGAGLVAKMNTKTIQKVMGIALLVVAFVMLAGLRKWLPVGGDAIGLTGIKLFIGVLANFVLGVLMTAGIGLYAPCTALVYFLGMSPAVAFPIMMGSCAFLMPVASAKFIKEGAYNRKVSVLFSIFGFVGVLLAAYVFSNLAKTYSGGFNLLQYLVVAVVAIASVVMLKDGFKKEPNGELEY